MASSQSTDIMSSDRRRTDDQMKLPQVQRNLNDPVCALDLPPESLRILHRMKITSLRDLWKFTKQELKDCGLTERELCEVLSKATAEKLESCNQLSSHLEAAQKRFTSGCPKLDHFFRGGFPHGRILEVCGPAGAGKTQLCLQLSLVIQLAKVSGGLGGDCLYLFTENGFPSRRLKQLSDHYAKHAGTDASYSAISLDNVFVETLNSFDKLEAFLTIRIHSLLAARPVRLIVIDSITNVFRYIDTEDVQIPQRARALQSIGTLLIGLQNTYGVSIVCANQISDAVQSSDLHGLPGNSVVPALGIAWANFVSTRIMLRKTYNSESRASPSFSPHREMCVLFSPCLPSTSMTFKITAEGIFASG
ncbi:uncharacterized protein LOC129595587 [Paramacrobiotus metropolitanus]|uniref:uncharacterized protein LOC129595587 n=1 Tax=Paramacrobiotus metropolitanus TaxID=2943436 RepID=UPI0024459581|nr:uncharacterized protein LOC129595587 [Paramacrobiotus metropolitanus]